jgi:hypothetical protein
MLALCISVLYALAVAAVIILLSGSPYDFMIGEDDNGHKMTACDLPTPSDDVSGFYAMVTCVLVLVLLITGLARSVRGRRLAPSMGAWGCAARSVGLRVLRANARLRTSTC